MGVHFLGWIPNATSKCQSMDVKIFGKLKPLLEPLAKKKKGFIDGGKDPNYQEALKEWAKQSDIREGRRIGVLPYGRKFILEHPDSGMRMKPYEGRDQLAVDRVNDITSCRQER